MLVHENFPMTLLWSESKWRIISLIWHMRDWREDTWHWARWIKQRGRWLSQAFSKGPLGEGQGLFDPEAQERGFWLISRNSEDFLGRTEYTGFGEGQEDTALCVQGGEKSSEHGCVQCWVCAMLALAKGLAHPVPAGSQRSSQKGVFISFCGDIQRN